jgi:hypothetical protein
MEGMDLYSHFTRAIYWRLLLTDVNEWNNNECAEYVLPHPNIRDWFTRSHPSKGENRSEIARVNGRLRI